MDESHAHRLNDLIWHGLQALETFITVPQSSMRSYTAIGAAATSDITKAVPHGSLAYKVCIHATPIFTLKPQLRAESRSPTVIE